MEIINIQIHSKTSTTDNIIYQLIIPEYLIFMKHNFKEDVIIIILVTIEQFCNCTFLYN